MEAKDSVLKTKQEFERCFKEGRFYDRQTSDDKHLEAILDSLQMKDSTRILDIGTGNGYLAYPIGARNPYVEVIGLDIVEDTLNRNRFKAQEQNLFNIEFVTYGGIVFPFDDAYFDVIVSRYALHHFPRITDTFKEINRVLKKGGQLFISDPTPNDNDISGFVDEFMQMKSDGHIKLYTHKEYNQMAQEVGLVENLFFQSEIRFPRKEAITYLALLMQHNKDIVDGYQIEIVEDEIFISEQVLNISYAKL